MAKARAMPASPFRTPLQQGLPSEGQLEQARPVPLPQTIPVIPMWQLRGSWGGRLGRAVGAEGLFPPVSPVGSRLASSCATKPSA